MGHRHSKSWDHHKEELVQELTLSKCRAEIISKRLNNELYELNRAVVSSKEECDGLVQKTLYKENHIKTLEILINIIESLIEQRHLLNSDSRNELIGSINTLIYCSYKMDIEELVVSRNILIQILGRRYCEKVLETKEKVDEHILEHLNRVVPTEDDVKKQHSKILEHYGIHEDKDDEKDENKEDLKSFRTGNEEYDSILSRVEDLKSNDL